MLLTPNILTASVLAHSFAGNVVVAVLIGVFTYFILNLIPHWDPQNYDRLIVKIARYLDFSFTSAYVIFMLFVLFQKGSILVFTLNSFEVRFDIYNVIGAFANLITYLVLYLFSSPSSKNAIWSWITRVDKKLRYVDRSVWGVFIQIALVILGVTFLFHLIDFPSWNKILTQLLK